MIINSLTSFYLWHFVAGHVLVSGWRPRILIEYVTEWWPKTHASVHTVKICPRYYTYTTAWWVYRPQISLSSFVSLKKIGKNTSFSWSRVTAVFYGFLHFKKPSLPLLLLMVTSHAYKYVRHRLFLHNNTYRYVDKVAGLKAFVWAEYCSTDHICI